MSELLAEECIDTMDLTLAIRALATGAPIVTKTTPTDPTDTGVTITGTGDGVLYVRPKVGATIDDYVLTVIGGGGGGTATDAASFVETITITAAGRIIDDDGNGNWTVDHGFVVGDFISLNGTALNDRNGKLYRILTIVNNSATLDRMTLETTETLTNETSIATTIKRWHSGVVINVRRDPGTANVDLGHMTSGRGAVFEDVAGELRLQLRTITPWVATDTLGFDIEANALVAATEDWTDNNTLIGTADDDLVYDVETYLEGPGISGTEAINCNFLTESSFAADRYNIHGRGADGFTGSAFASQPNASPPVYCAGSANPMVLWATVSGDRIMYMFRAAAGVFEHGYMGFGDTLGDTGQHPRPMIIGGSSWDSTVEPSDSGTSHSAWWDAATDTTTPSRTSQSSCYHRWVDGQWFAVANKGSGGSRTGNSHLWWTPRQFNADFVSIGSETGYSESNFYDQVRPSPDTPTDRYQFQPITLIMKAPDDNIILEAQGFFFTSGFSASSEDTATISADEYVFGNNVNASGQGDLGILKLTGP